LHGEEGAELVELALSAPILFGLVFGLMQICLAFYTYEYISELAREGARYAAVHGPSCETSASVSCSATAASVNAYVTGLANFNLGGGSMTVSTTYPGTGGELVSNPVVVKITYAFPYKIPYIKSTTLTMTSTSQMTIVQ
jgi:Flp pilus assembly protein TadG